MKVFGISDLHLSFASNKPMDRYGDIWTRHWEKIEQHWRERVRAEDVVLVAGDHSWGLKLADALPDLQFIANLPGTKIMSKGNHDLWWSTAKLEKLGLAGTRWLQGTSTSMHGICVAATRGWALPGTEFNKTPEDVAIFNREVGRLRMALESLPQDGCRIAMMHYPPLLQNLMDTEFTRLMETFGVQRVVYGHLHLSHLEGSFEGLHNGVEYRLVSCDVVGFAPVEILEV